MTEHRGQAGLFPPGRRPGTWSGISCRRGEARVLYNMNDSENVISCGEAEIICILNVLDDTCGCGRVSFTRSPTQSGKS